MRRKIIIGNWKMNMTKEETKSLLTAIKLKINTKNKDVVFAVPYTDLDTAMSILQDTKISVASQNMDYHPRGAYTGEISAEMLKEIGVEYAIIGHSERREYFNETDETVNQKTKFALENNIIPIICVGEKLEEREQNIHLDKIRTQVKKAIADVEMRDIENVIIAYEPIWAIGTGKTATKEEAEEICSFIRYVIAETYGMSVSENIRIIYGGSVNKENSKEILNMENIDGALVGGASLKPTFSDIINE